MFATTIEELTALPDQALDDRVRDLELQQRQLDVAKCAAIAVAQQRQLNAVDGHWSMTGYLRATLNWSTTEANKWRAVARLLDAHRTIGDAWHHGTIGLPQVQQFVRLHQNKRISDRLGDAIPTLLGYATTLSFKDFFTCIERFIAVTDTDGAHKQRDRAIEDRDAQVHEVGGALDITAHGGDPITATEIKSIHNTFVELEYQHDLQARRTEHGNQADAHPLARTGQQRRFDALIEIFRRANNTTTPGVAAQPLVNIIIDVDTWNQLLANNNLTGDDDSLLDELINGDVPLDQRRCETSDGTQLHPHDVLHAALAGHIRRVIVNAAGRPVDLGRKSRLFTGAAKEAAKLLVTHCEHPGCELPADWCDVDHATEWADLGATDQDNASIRCGPHNRAKHRHRWQSKRATNGTTYTVRADGTIMLPVGADPPTFHQPEPEPDRDGTSRPTMCPQWRIRKIDYADLKTIDPATLWN